MSRRNCAAAANGMEPCGPDHHARGVACGACADPKNDEHNRARAGDMEAAILDAIEALTEARSERLRMCRATGRSAEILESLGDRLLMLMDEIDDARNAPEHARSCAGRGGIPVCDCGAEPSMAMERDA